MQKTFMAVRGFIGFTLISLAMMTDSALALTVIDPNLPPDSNDWTSNSNLNSISNVSAATCGGLDADALQNCLNQTNFDIDIQNPAPNPELENQQNNDINDDQTIVDNNGGMSGSNSGDNVVTNSIPADSPAMTQNTDSNAVLSQSTNYQVEEENSIETFVVKSEDTTTKSAKTLPELTTEKPQAEDTNIVNAATAKPTKKYLKKKIVPIQAAPENIADDQNDQKLVETFNKISLEMNNATADIFTDWAKS
ncbi:hypothetical protein IT412_01865, partial [Candidatus Peregrinibacteria bacterium]|nr:hypothetical protein [Candidatus Peregrinibacteria bacterium]